MHKIRKGILLTALLLCTGVLASCGWKDRGPNIPDSNLTPTPTPLAVTYTPTPYQARQPLVPSVNADAYSVVPRFSGLDEPVWKTAKSFPIEKTVTETGDTKADAQIFYSDNLLYIRVNVEDTTRTITNTVDKSDHVKVYLNEKADCPGEYAAGDCYCTVLRDGRLVYGPGCDTAKMKAVGFDTGNGYVIQVLMPLTTVKATKGTKLGFDIVVTDLDGDMVVKKLAFCDTSGKTDRDLSGIGVLELGKDTTSALPKPVIDGKEEALWETVSYIPLQNPAWGKDGAEAGFKVMWDTDRLYLLIQVSDDTPNSEGTVMTRKDSVEVFLCGDGSKSETYRKGKDMHVRIGRDGGLECGNGASVSAIEYKVTGNAEGYLVEVSLPVPKESMEHGNFLGLDIHVNDSEGEGQRNKILTWSDTTLLTNKDLSDVGTINIK